MTSRTAILILLLLLCTTVPLLSQGFGTISGTISDPSGAVVPEAKVTATEVATGLVRTSVASREGYYVLNSLRPTEYVLTVEEPGFERYRQTSIVLLANQ